MRPGKSFLLIVITSPEIPPHSPKRIDTCDLMVILLNRGGFDPGSKSPFLPDAEITVENRFSYLYFIRKTGGMRSGHR